MSASARLAAGADLVLGLWLFASVFVLSHPFIRALHGAILGALVVTVALATITTGVGRLLRINAGLAAWLALSALVIRSGTGAPIANDLIVAALVFAFSIRPVVRVSSTSSAA